jgi:hypothetical protein
MNYEVCILELVKRDVRKIMEVGVGVHISQQIRGLSRLVEICGLSRLVVNTSPKLIIPIYPNYFCRHGRNYIVPGSLRRCFPQKD